MVPDLNSDEDGLALGWTVARCTFPVARVKTGIGMPVISEYPGYRTVALRLLYAHLLKDKINW